MVEPVESAGERAVCRKQGKEHLVGDGEVRRARRGKANLKHCAEDGECRERNSSRYIRSLGRSRGHTHSQAWQQCRPHISSAVN